MLLSKKQETPACPCRAVLFNLSHCTTDGHVECMYWQLCCVSRSILQNHEEIFTNWDRTSQKTTSSHRLFYWLRNKGGNRFHILCQKSKKVSQDTRVPW